MSAQNVKLVKDTRTDMVAIYVGIQKVVEMSMGEWSKMISTPQSVQGLGK